MARRKLQLVPDPPPTTPPPMAAEAAAWCASVLQAYDLDSTSVALVHRATEALERGLQARDIVRREGLTVRTADGGVKVHPAVAIERDSRAAFARLCRQLCLDGTPDSLYAR